VLDEKRCQSEVNADVNGTQCHVVSVLAEPCDCCMRIISVSIWSVSAPYGLQRGNASSEFGAI